MDWDILVCAVPLAAFLIAFAVQAMFAYRQLRRGAPTWGSVAATTDEVEVDGTAADLNDFRVGLPLGTTRALPVFMTAPPRQSLFDD